jgi:hypothetical protein
MTTFEASPALVHERGRSDGSRSASIPRPSVAAFLLFFQAVFPGGCWRASPRPANLPLYRSSHTIGWGASRRLCLTFAP